MAVILHQEYYLAPGEWKLQLISIDNRPYLDDLIIVANGPTEPWFEWQTAPRTVGHLHVDHIIQFELTAPLTFGTWEFNFIEVVEPGVYRRPREWKIVIHVTSGASTYYNCCGDRNIAWLNIQGGWQNYIFTGIKTFQVEVGKPKQFKTNQLVAKYAQIEGVYNGEVLTTGDIPKEHVDVLDGLKYAIQAYLYNDETETWDIPILVDVESFTKYKSRDKFFEVRLKFIYAEEILIQTQ